MDTKGIKILQDKNQKRLQKLGMSVGDDGTAYIVLGSGDGSGEVTINGVKYSNGSLLYKKTRHISSFGTVGGSTFYLLWMTAIMDSRR